MKLVYSATAVTLLVLAGCSNQSDLWAEKAGDVAAAIEVEIAIRSHPFEPGDAINEGEFFVVSSNVIPIRSTVGPGHAISSVDGVIMELQWDDVRLLQSRNDQYHRYESRISFENVRFNIQNQLVRPDGVTHLPGSGPDSLTLDGTFHPIFSPLNFSSPADDGERALVIRARLLTEPPPARPLSLPVDNAGQSGKGFPPRTT